MPPSSRRRKGVSSSASDRHWVWSDGRATTTVVASVLLVGIVVACASLVGVAVLGVAGATGEGPGAPIANAESAVAPTVLDVSVRGDRVVFVHRGGGALDVRTLRLVLSVDGERLAHQPPVPFFAARGFRAGPTGPFNSATSPRWTAGERAGFRVAGTNAPAVRAGTRVNVDVYAEGRWVASLETRVGA